MWEKKRIKNKLNKKNYIQIITYEKKKKGTDEIKE